MSIYPVSVIARYFRILPLHNQIVVINSKY